MTSIDEFMETQARYFLALCATNREEAKASGDAIMKAAHRQQALYDAVRALRAAREAGALDEYRIEVVRDNEVRVDVHLDEGNLKAITCGHCSGKILAFKDGTALDLEGDRAPIVTARMPILEVHGE